MKPSQEDDPNHPNQLIYEPVQIPAAALQTETNTVVRCKHIHTMDGGDESFPASLFPVRQIYL